MSECVGTVDTFSGVTHRNTHSKSQCAYYTQVQASLHRAFDADAGLEAAGIQLAQNISLQRAYKSGSVQITRVT